jgi:hypothetical protein
VKASLSFGKVSWLGVLLKQGGALSEPPHVSPEGGLETAAPWGLNDRSECLKIPDLEVGGSCHSNHRVERLEIGILFRQVAEGAIHLEADLQVLVRVPDVAEKRVVAAHVVVIDGFL